MRRLLPAASTLVVAVSAIIAAGIAAPAVAVPAVAAPVSAAPVVAAPVSAAPTIAAPAHMEETAPDGVQSWALTPANGDGPDGRGSFDYTVEPGDVYSDAVAVRNVGSTPITVELHALDAVQTPESDFGLLEQGETGPVSEWVRLEQEAVTVEPHASVVVPFRFDVPRDAEPGDHAGGIVATSVIGEGSGDDVQFRVGTRIHLRVAGPVEPALRIDNVTAPAPWTMLPFANLDLPVGATLVNAGNVRLAPEAKVEVRALFGLWSASVDVADVTELLPDGAHSISATLDGVPQLGPLWVTVSVPKVTSLGQDLTAFTDVTSQTMVIWATPWTLILFGVLICIALAIAMRNLVRRRRIAAEAKAKQAPAEASKV